MSLVGIDVGSSAVKAAAYSEACRYLAGASSVITPVYPAPGQWETDPLDVWRATSQTMQELGAQDTVRRDPVRAIAISASGRENFPADASGFPLGNGLMGADVRGEEFEAVPPDQLAPEMLVFALWASARADGPGVSSCLVEEAPTGDHG